MTEPELGSGWVGPLGNHIGAFVPESLRDGDLGVRLFAAAAYGQCAHYVATIGVLPASAVGEARPSLPWPKAAGMVALIAVPTVLLLGGYAVDFAWARSMYGVVASVHAWVEIPMLLLALNPSTFNEQPDTA